MNIQCLHNVAWFTLEAIIILKIYNKQRDPFLQWVVNMRIQYLDRSHHQQI